MSNLRGKNTARIYPFNSNKRIAVKPKYFLLTFSCFIKKLVRSYSVTLVKRVDSVTSPLLVTSLAFNTPYSPSILSNPIGAAFLVLIGMATTLYYVSTPMFNFFLWGEPTIFSVEQANYIFTLFDEFLSREKYTIRLLLNDLSPSYDPELLRGFYFQIQELITIKEYSYLSLFGFYDHPSVQAFIAEGHVPTIPVLDTERAWAQRYIANRILPIHWAYRHEGCNLVHLLRSIENYLWVPTVRRVPSFWFEDSERMLELFNRFGFYTI